MVRSAINKAAKTYAGLDVSLKETAICVVDDTGKIVFERSVATDPQVIAKYLAKHAVGLERFGLAVDGEGERGSEFLNASSKLHVFFRRGELG